MGSANAFCRWLRPRCGAQRYSVHCLPLLVIHEAGSYGQCRRTFELLCGLTFAAGEPGAKFNRGSLWGNWPSDERAAHAGPGSPETIVRPDRTAMGVSGDSVLLDIGCIIAKKVGLRRLTAGY